MPLVLQRLFAPRALVYRITAAVVVCALLTPLDMNAVPARPAPAYPAPVLGDDPGPHAAFDGLGNKSKTTLIVATLVATVAVIGVGVYFAVRQAHTVKGCVAAGAGGLALQTGSGKNFVLLGATSNIRTGELVKVTGSRRKSVDGVTQQASFVVDKVDRDYGACSVTPAQP